MTWKACRPMDERLKFIARLLDGEQMAGVPGVRYLPQDRLQILTRYNEIGLEGLTDRSRRRYRHANQLPFQIETQIVRLNQDKPSWGHRRSGSGWSVSIRTFIRRRSARYMRSSIATAWSNAEGRGATGQPERNSRGPANPMNCRLVERSSIVSRPSIGIPRRTLNSSAIFATK
jgi:hypothetical protein